MGIARERVVPRPPRRAWAGFAALGWALGIAFGFLLFVLTQWLQRRVLPSQSVSSTAFLALYVSVLMLLLLPLPLLLRVTQRWTACLAFAAMFALMCGGTAELMQTLGSPDGGADRSSWPEAEEWLAVGMFAGGYIAVAAVLRMLYRFLLVRTTEFRGGDCAWCGYTPGSEAIARCPECGHDVQSRRFRSHGLVMGAMAVVWRWKTLALTGLGMLALIARGPIVQKTIPCVRFYGAFPAAQRLTPATKSALLAPDLPTVWIPHPTLSDRGIRVLFEPRAADGRERISTEVTGTSATSYSLGAGRVYADITGPGVARVLRNGLPAGLVDALYAKANEIAWTPASAPRGAWRVDAGPHLEASRPRSE